MGNMTDKTLILTDRKTYSDFSVSVPEEQGEFFESVMKAHGWKCLLKGNHRNKALIINLDNLIRSEK